MIPRTTNFSLSGWILGFVVLSQFFSISPGWTEQKNYLAAMDVRQKLNQLIPLEVKFKDESGKDVALKEYFLHKPVLLTFIYFSCPMLCPLNIKSLSQSLKVLDESPARDYELLVVSIDPQDTHQNAAERKKLFSEVLNKPGSKEGIHFLTGELSAIQKTTEATGFHYVKLKESGQYAHPAVLITLTPQGRISRYMFGLDYPPRDVRLALMESRQAKIGSLVDKILMYCFTYNPQVGRYSMAVLNLLKLGAIFTVLLIGGLIYLLKTQESNA